MKKSIRKPLLIGLSLALVAVISVMGTLAYLTAQTSPVTNTFTAAGLNVAAFTLDEAPAVKASDGTYTLDNTAARVQANAYEIIPGATLPKDPKITIQGLEMDAYLFLKVEDSTVSDISWTMMDTGWTALTGQTGIYYREVAADPGDYTISLIQGDAMTVAADYNGAAGEDCGSLVFTAYLAQKAGFANASAAWDATFGAPSANP